MKNILLINLTWYFSATRIYNVYINKPNNVPNASLGAHLKAINVVNSTFRAFSYEHYLYRFLYMKCKHLIHQYLHAYGLSFSMHKIMYIS